MRDTQIFQPMNSEEFKKHLAGMSPMDRDDMLVWVEAQPGFGNWLLLQLKATGRIRLNEDGLWEGRGKSRVCRPLSKVDYAAHSEEKMMPLLRKVVPDMGSALSLKAIVRALRERGVECRDTPMGELLRKLYLEGKVAVVDGRWWVQAWEECGKEHGEQALVNGRWGPPEAWFGYEEGGSYKWRRMVKPAARKEAV